MTAAIKHPFRKRETLTTSVEPLEVAVITHFFAGHGGGIELVADRLVREIAPMNTFHFSWLASDCDPAPVIDGQASLSMRCCNWIEKMLGLPWPVWGWRSLSLMKKTIQRSDIVWLHDTLYFGNILAMRMARKAQKPILITQHIGPIPYKNVLLRRLMQLADALFTAPMLKKAHAVTFISDRIADDYYERIPFTRPIKIIPNGVDLHLFHPPIAENRRFLRQQFALKDDQPILLFVGRFVEKKGLEVIRRLALLLPEYRFWMAGTGPIDPDEWMLPNIHVLRNRKGQSLAELYQAADLLLMPGYGEGFPLVIQEAMACGLPVLCGPATAQGNQLAAPFLHIAEVWPNNPDRTVSVWYEKIRKFPIPLPLTEPQTASAEFALTYWDWHPIAKVYADILNNLAAERR